jgi:predicted transcriptional regulator
VVQAAHDALMKIGKHEHFGDWMAEEVEELGLSLQELSKRTGLTLHALAEVARMQGYLSEDDQEIEHRIVAALLRASLERKFGHAH